MYILLMLYVTINIIYILTFKKKKKNIYRTKSTGVRDCKKNKQIRSIWEPHSTIYTIGTL